jgi:hypothetical protein
MDTMNGRVDEILKEGSLQAYGIQSIRLMYSRISAPFFTTRKSPEIIVAFLNLKGLSRLVEPFNMGGSISKMMNKLFANREMRILMLGLDAAGKTSTLPSPLTPLRHFPLSEKCSNSHLFSDIVQTEIESTVCSLL